MFSILRTHQAMSPLREAFEGGDDAFRDAVLQASRRMDRKLQKNPRTAGESRGRGVRILFEGPLGVLFRVDQGKNLVRVLRGWSISRKTTRWDHQ